MYEDEVHNALKLTMAQRVCYVLEALAALSSKLPEQKRAQTADDFEDTVYKYCRLITSDFDEKYRAQLAEFVLVESLIIPLYHKHITANEDNTC